MIGIGDFVKVNRRGKITREGQKLFKGKKYRLDKKSGYYVCTTGDRERLHVAVWKDKWGVSVPVGCVIHHLDWNKDNNSVDNLLCVEVWEHEKIHNTLGGEAGRAYGYSLVESRVCGLPPDIYVDK